MGVSRIPSGNEPCVRYEPRRASDDERIRRVRRDATTRRTARPRATALIEQAKQKREHGPERRIAAFSALPAYAATRRTGASTGAERQRRCESLNSGRRRTGRRPATLKRIASTKVTRELPRANGSRHGPDSCSARLQQSTSCPEGSGTWSACPVEMARGGGHVALPAGHARDVVAVADADDAIRNNARRIFRSDEDGARRGAQGRKRSSITHKTCVLTLKCPRWYASVISSRSFRSSPQPAARRARSRHVDARARRAASFAHARNFSHDRWRASCRCRRAALRTSLCFM